MKCIRCRGSLTLQNGGLLRCQKCKRDELVAHIVAEQARKMGLVVVEVSEKRILVGIEVTSKSTTSNHPPIAVAEVSILLGSHGECGVVVAQKVFGDLRPKVDELLRVLRAGPVEGVTVLKRGEYIKAVSA